MHRMNCGQCSLEYVYAGNISEFFIHLDLLRSLFIVQSFVMSPSSKKHHSQLESFMRGGEGIRTLIDSLTTW